MSEEILIVLCNYDDAKLEGSNLWEDAQMEDENLSNALDKYQKEDLDPNDIEVYEKKNNILATEKGLYIALYLKDIISFESSEEDIK